jgi:hypothetical protein
MDFMKQPGSFAGCVRQITQQRQGGLEPTRQAARQSTVPWAGLNKERTMDKTLDAGLDGSLHGLTELQLETVAGGTPGYPGLPLGTRINVSPWGQTTSFDTQWALVGATGTLPR